MGGARREDVKLWKIVVVIVLLIVFFPRQTGDALNRIVPPAVKDAVSRMVDDVKTGR
jgi:hypothetical protein